MVPDPGEPAMRRGGRGQAHTAAASPCADGVSRVRNIGGAEHKHRRVEHPRPHADVDLAVAEQAVCPLKVKHRAAGERPVDAVHGKMGEGKHLVEPVLKRGHERAMTADLKHDLRTVGPGHTAAGVSSSIRRTGTAGCRSDNLRERGTAGHRGAQGERNALAATARAAAQLLKPPPLA
jgi:hypothetical protein